ncbi:unnamed protein product [Candidula unifasciata]|uniref:EGF-like domain-containing protein n=1 Tax=Candidula unifasciata TaxID=100452 RepID=A0A8S3YZG9_9EUPU|nr:unnamed protein product [Candidula unifasciata]
MQTVHVMTGLLLFFDLRLCSQETGCEQGWFGSQCQYKCRCTHNYCDKEGRCKSGDRCDKGWFGPACQYVDEAFGTSTLREVTDGDDDTCVSDPATRRIAISVVLMFTWLRVHFSTDGRYQPVASLFKLCPDTSLS